MTKQNIRLLRKMVRIDPCHIKDHMLKLFEEVGELAVEIEIEGGLKGGKPGKDGVRGESVDVAIMALTVFVKHGGKMDQFDKIFKLKCKKWEGKLKDKNIKVA